jgi:hypothetical protein
MTRTLEAIFTTHHLLHNLQMDPNKLYIMLIMKGFFGTNTSLLGQLLSSEENRYCSKNSLYGEYALFQILVW